MRLKKTIESSLKARGTQVFPFAPARFLLLFAVVFTILIARKPDAVSAPQFFAEDATVFLRDALTRGPTALFLPYNGYLHLVPRIAAMAYAAAPAALAPALCSILSLCSQTFAFSLFYLPGCRYLIRSDALRAATAVVMAAVLDGGEGLIGTCADVQWHLVPAGLILLFLPNNKRAPAGRLGPVAAMLASVLLCLTVSMLTIMLPFSIYRAFTRTGRERAIASTFSVALSLQAIVFFLLLHNQTAADLSVPRDVVRLTIGLSISWIYRVFVTDFAGKDIAFAINHAPSPAMFFLVAGLALLALAWLVFCTMRRHRPLLAILFYVTSVSIAVALLGRNLVGYFQLATGSSPFFAPRFFEPAGFMLIFQIAFALDRAGRPPAGYWKVFAMLVIFSCAVRGNFRLPSYPDLHWANYAPALQRWEDHHRQNLPVQALHAPILPPGWTLALPAGTGK